MNVYWSQNDIPALKGLSRKDREAAKRRVVRQVWKHWQVWIPFAVFLAVYVVFLTIAPRFPYRLPIVVVTGLVVAKVAALPYNHYLDFYLQRNEPKS